MAPASSGGGSSAAPVRETPLPKLKVFVLCMIQTAEALALASILPMVPFMITEEFKLAHDPRDIGYYAGYLIGAFALAQFCSSFAWGALSDRVGRRPVLLSGTVGTFLCINAFGFSKSYAWAMVSRSLAGALNGNLGVVKTYLGEITDKTNQARAFSLISLNYGLGNVIGPAIGGFLCRPAHKFPSVFQGTLFDRFPYLLPTMISTLPLLIAFVVGIFALTETLPPRSRRHVRPAGAGAPRPAGSPRPVAVPLRSSFRRARVPRTESGAQLLPVGPSSEEGSGGSGGEGGGEGYSAGEDDAARRVPLRVRWAPAERKAGVGYTPVPEEEDVEEGVRPSAATGDRSRVPAVASTPGEDVGTGIIFRDKKTMGATAIYGLCALVYIIYDELFPIWAVNPPEKHGVGFSSSEIGACQSAGGAVLACYQMLVFPTVAKRLRLKRTLLVGFVACLPLCFLPDLGRLALAGAPKALLIAGGMFAMSIRAACGSTAFTAAILMVNNSAPASHLGAVNGLGQSLASLVRAFGPAVGSTVFAWSLSAGLPFPLDAHLVFAGLGVVGGAAFFLGYRLPDSIDRPRKTWAEDGPEEEGGEAREDGKGRAAGPAAEPDGAVDREAPAATGSAAPPLASH
eukprot:tig00021434_g21302.t1